TEATAAYIRGEMRTYFRLIQHSDAWTLFPPYGGEAVRGADVSEERMDSLERMFQGGEASPDIVQAVTSGDLAVITGIERQHGKVAGFAPQDWSLRVTLVFRREDGEWRQIHRHADPLVKGITMEELSAIAKR
ncbi:MAG TPA: nuclear transport factor 2 family protein, partial [Thermomicrobiales bacterium]|nr:nuclear transport factor 2 family protein [Thermomicrobiales bacterium]